MLLVMKRITITLDDSIFEQLKAASEESMRPVATEALYRIRLGLGVAIQPRVELGKSDKGSKVEKSSEPTKFSTPDRKLEELVSSGIIQKGEKVFAGSGDTYLS